MSSGVTPVIEVTNSCKGQAFGAPRLPGIHGSGNSSTVTAMLGNPYVAFLPEARRGAAQLRPEETWWSWEGHRVHIARARRAGSPSRLLVIHGAGGHSGALWPLAALLADRGLDVAAVDLPLYGRTVTAHPEQVRYDHWVRLLCDLVAAEHDGRPLVVLGASIGGLLGLEVAARSGGVAAVTATCLINPRELRTQAHLTRFGPLGMLGGPLARLARGPVATATVPMRWVANLGRMSRDPGLTRLCAIDPRGGGARVPLGFLASWLRFRHTAPERITTQVTLLHPAEDAWTPVELSMRTLRRLAGPSRAVMLRGCGHFPVEEPGLGDLIDETARVALQLRHG